MSKNQSYIFGPVPSRRLGRSLGVDLIPYKTCSYDCVYCQLGRTKTQTVLRDCYVPGDQVLKQLKEKLESGIEADFITLSGSGEPTLNKDFGKIISEAKNLTDVPVAVITNGSMLWDPDVRRELDKADLVVPSLDAGEQAVFERVNRPHPGVSFEKMVEGLRQFSQGYKGRIWLEVFLLEGLNSSKADVRKISALADNIKPEIIQLNTVARPPAYSSAEAVPEEKMNDLSGLFSGNVEVIADYHHIHKQKDFSIKREDVLNMLERRPCTLEDVCESLGIHPNEAVKHLDSLIQSGDIITEETAGKRFYVKTES